MFSLIILYAWFAKLVSSLAVWPDVYWIVKPYLYDENGINFVAIFPVELSVLTTPASPPSLFVSFNNVFAVLVSLEIAISPIYKVPDPI